MHAQKIALGLSEKERKKDSSSALGLTREIRRTEIYEGGELGWGTCMFTRREKTEMNWSFGLSIYIYTILAYACMHMASYIHMTYKIHV